jgi:hypothetical protein
MQTKHKLEFLSDALRLREDFMAEARRTCPGELEIRGTQVNTYVPDVVLDHLPERCVETAERSLRRVEWARRTVARLCSELNMGIGF